MKSIIRLLFLLLLSAITLPADDVPIQVNNKISVYNQPAENATLIAVIDKVSEESMSDNLKAPEGWTAITLRGPQTVYILGSDTLKSGDIRVGAPYYTKPDAESPVLGLAEQGDNIEVTDLIGRWTQLELKKDIVAYIKGTVYNPISAESDKGKTSTDSETHPAAKEEKAPETNTPPAPATASVSGNKEENAETLISPAPEPEPLIVPAATSVTITDTHIYSLPIDPQQNMAKAHKTLPARSYRGILTSSKSLFQRNPPYPYQIRDDSGRRFAYLDFSHSKQRDRVEAFLDRPVVIQGILRAIPGSTQEGVINVESIQFENFRK